MTQAVREKYASVAASTLSSKLAYGGNIGGWPLDARQAGL